MKHAELQVSRSITPGISWLIVWAIWSIAQEFWVLLEKSVTKADEIDYNDFIRVSKLIQDQKAKYVHSFTWTFESNVVCLSHRRYFTARTFARLSKGRSSISAISLFNFIFRKEWFCQTKIALSLYDVHGKGYLTEHVSRVNERGKCLSLMHICDFLFMSGFGKLHHRTDSQPDRGLSQLTGSYAWIIFNYPFIMLALLAEWLRSELLSLLRLHRCS